MAEKFKAWITQRALSEGIREVEVEGYNLNDTVVYDPQAHVHYYEKEWHRTREGAAARAEDMRAERIAALNSQLTRLRSMRF